MQKTPTLHYAVTYNTRRVGAEEVAAVLSATSPQLALSCTEERRGIIKLVSLKLETAEKMS